MARDLSRLLRPRSIAVVGGGAWCRATIEQCRKMGFAGDIWPVHPSAGTVAGLPAYPDITALPAAPDACFIGVNRHATIDVVAALSARGAGGAVCFASGFAEAQEEDADATALQARLLHAAGDMPILGPNCYGFINYLDGALLWPDQHGGTPCTRGAAIITQSSNIALNLTMQARGLPLAYVVTVGNQAQTGMAEIGAALLADDRVTCLGLHIEGIGDLRAFEALAGTARRLGKRIIALKLGRSEQAQQAAISHTASLAGGDAGAASLLARLGIARVGDLPAFLETLKLLHVAGPLPSARIATMSCSGGEASLAADLAHGSRVTFPPLNTRQKTDLRTALGPMVALANPLDYHTYIWRDVPAMARAFAAMVDPDLALTLLIVDFPRPDRCDPSDWDCTVEALIAAKQQTGGALGLIATLPEALPEDIATRLTGAGLVAFSGLAEALQAIEAASLPLPPSPAPLCLPGLEGTAPTRLIPEAEAKDILAAHGLRIPRARRARAADVAGAAEAVGFPVVLKSEGLAHKTEAGGVALNLRSAAQVAKAAAAMPGASFLIEEMIGPPVAELLIGVLRDPAHGFVLTLAAGGTLTELMQDSAALLIPATREDIDAALNSLRLSALLDGYRGAPPADRGAILDAITAIQSYVMAHADGLEEIEVNPLICTPDTAVAADALLRRKDCP